MSTPKFGEFHSGSTVLQAQLFSSFPVVPNFFKNTNSNHYFNHQQYTNLELAALELATSSPVGPRNLMQREIA